MKRILAWLLPLLTSIVTVGFFFLMSSRSALLTRAVGYGHLTAAVFAGVAAIVLNVLAVAAFGVVAANDERRL